MNQTESDAREFGRHYKNGGWYLAMLVARSVEPGTGEGGDPKTRNHRRKCASGDPAEKMSCREFARLAGVHHSTVQYHYDAWVLASQSDGAVVRHPSLLKPGDDDTDSIDNLVNNDDPEEKAEELKRLWQTYSQKARRKKKEPKSPEPPKNPIKPPITEDEKIAADAALLASGGQIPSDQGEPAPAVVVVELEEIAARELDYEDSADYLKLVLQLASVASKMVKRERILTEDRTIQNIRKANKLLSEFPFLLNDIISETTTTTTTQLEKEGSR